MPSARLSNAVAVGGNITLVTTSSVYVEVAGKSGGPGAGGLDLTIAAAAGDVLLINGTCTLPNTTAVGVEFDFATIVSAAAVNWVGQSAGGNNNGLALAGSGVLCSVPLNAQYVVQAGDISGGNVLLRLMYLASGTRVLARSVGSGALTLSVANLLH